MGRVVRDRRSRVRPSFLMNARTTAGPWFYFRPFARRVCYILEFDSNLSWMDVRRSKLYDERCDSKMEIRLKPRDYDGVGLARQPTI